MNNRAENSHQPTRTLLATDAAIQIPRASERDFYLHLDQFAITFTPSNINSLHNDTENNCANDLKINKKLLGWKLLHNLMDRYFLGTKVLNFAPVPLS